MIEKLTQIWDIVVWGVILFITIVLSIILFIGCILLHTSSILYNFILLGIGIGIAIESYLWFRMFYEGI